MSVEELMIRKEFKYHRKRLRRLCCCSTLWLISAAILFLSGVYLLAKFTKYWGNKETKKRFLAYIGCVLVIASVITLTIAVICCVLLKKLYKYSTKDQKSIIQRKKEHQSIGDQTDIIEPSRSNRQHPMPSTVDPNASFHQIMPNVTPYPIPAPSQQGPYPTSPCPPPGSLPYAATPNTYSYPYPVQNPIGFNPNLQSYPSESMPMVPMAAPSYKA